MRTVAEIYDEYRIPPWLREHQLRVAAVGAIVARAASIDDRSVILTDLFHDMGNILKIDLSPGKYITTLIPESDVPEWRAVQDDFRDRFGDDEHAASLKIAREIGIPEEVVAMIDNMRFSRTEWIVREASVEMQLAKYGDLRVGPFGILSMDERLAEARDRYRGKAFDKGEEYTPESLKHIEDMCHELESIVLAAAKLEASQINDESAAPLIEEMRTYQV